MRGISAGRQPVPLPSPCSAAAERRTTPRNLRASRPAPSPPYSAADADLVRRPQNRVCSSTAEFYTCTFSRSEMPT